ncbi:hypothetical protein AGMMS50262_15150 [Bacteroidia bacterium]|nr:hypothetical protein AGMMS50262_15150 [Bacteroidia bacterium]
MTKIQHIEQPNLPKHSQQLFTDICGLIEGARQRLATTANAAICITNWQIGKRIKEDVLFNQHAEYGAGWGYEKLKHCVSGRGVAYRIDFMFGRKHRAIAITREHYNEKKIE